MANNQIVNFNRQDVANAYRRNQYAQALQERMNAPIPVNTFQGFQAPVSPAAGIAKALDIYSVWQNEKNQEKQYQDEKAAAEQKVLDENSRLEQERGNFVSTFNQPTYSETPMPDARSSSESGIPLDQPRADVYTATPKTSQEKLAFALSRIGDPNQLVSTTAKGYVDQASEDIKAKALIDKDALIRRDKLTDYGTQLTDQEKVDTTKNTRAVDAATIKFGRDTVLKEMDVSNRNMPTRKEKIESDAQEKAKDNVETTLKRLDKNYKKLKDIGGMRTQTGNRLSNLKAEAANALPYAAQGKAQSLLRESLDSDLQSLVMPAMKASGMTSKQMDTPAEVARYMKTLGGTNISYEANQPILERLHRELVGRSNNPYNKDTNIDSVLDMYAPKEK